MVMVMKSSLKMTMTTTMMSMMIDDANHDDDDDDDEQPHCQRLYDQLGQGSYFPPLDLSP